MEVRYESNVLEILDVGLKNKTIKINRENSDD